MKLMDDMKNRTLHLDEVQIGRRRKLTVWPGSFCCTLPEFYKATSMCRVAAVSHSVAKGPRFERAFFPQKAKSLWPRSTKGENSGDFDFPRGEKDSKKRSGGGYNRGLPTEALSFLFFAELP
jgi:hypothetical protein